MSKFKDFFNEAGAGPTTIPRAPMPTPGSPGLNLPNLYAHPLPLTGPTSISQVVHHRQEEERPEGRVLGSLQRLANGVWSNPAAFADPRNPTPGYPIKQGEDILGIPMVHLTNPTSLSAGEGKMVASQVELAKRLNIITCPSTAIQDDQHFDLHIAALRAESLKYKNRNVIGSGLAHAADNALNRMVTPGQHAQPLQRAVLRP